MGNSIAHAEKEEIVMNEPHGQENLPILPGSYFIS